MKYGAVIKARNGIKIEHLETCNWDKKIDAENWLADRVKWCRCMNYKIEDHYLTNNN